MLSCVPVPLRELYYLLAQGSLLEESRLPSRRCSINNRSWNLLRTEIYRGLTTCQTLLNTSPELVSLLFSPFYERENCGSVLWSRSRNSNKRSGIRICIKSKTSVLRHEAIVAVKSKVGHGTTGELPIKGDHDGEKSWSQTMWRMKKSHEGRLALRRMN